MQRSGCVESVRTLLVVLAIALLTGPTAARADISASIGFQGYLKAGRWTPVTLRGVGPAVPVDELCLAISDPDGQPVEFPLVRNGDVLEGTILAGRLEAPLILKRRTGDRESVLARFSQGQDFVTDRQSTDHWVIVGDHPGFEAAAELMEQTGRSVAGPAVRLLECAPDEFPRDWQRLGSVDLVVLGPLSLEADQFEALQLWVRQGGRLVIAVGSQADWYSASPLASWVPVRISEAYTEWQVEPLMSQVQSFVENAPTPRTIERPRLSRLEVSSGRVLVEGPNGVVTARSPYGFGTVAVAGIDLSAPPFARRPESRDAETETILWAGLPQFCVQLAGLTLPPPVDENRDRRLNLAPTGVSDLQSQLTGILDDYPGVNRPSSWNVIGLLAVYLLLIGPVDYLLVHRLLKRPQLTWVTLPVWIVLAAWWTSGLAVASNGTTRQANQIDIWDIATDTNVQRVRSWFSVYSPQTTVYDVSSSLVTPSADGPGRFERLGWLARPEDGFRGMYRRGGLSLGGTGYRQSNDGTGLDGVPIEMWSSKGFSLVAEGELPAGEPLAECVQEYDATGRLRRWTLEHNLPGEVTDWFVISSAQAVFPTRPEVEVLRPGMTVDLANRFGTQLLRTYVQGEAITTRETTTGTQSYVRTNAYDPLSRDPDHVFRALTVYRAIEGLEFTQLTNQTLDELDLSRFVGLDRILLIGRLDQPINRFSIDGAPVEPGRHATYVRLIIPVVRKTYRPF